MIGILLSLTLTAIPLAADRETEWSGWLAQRWTAIAEARTPDNSRVDVLTESYAWEVEWAEKWQQSIGQALYYQAATGRRGGVILLMGRKGDNKTEYLRCLVACREAGLRLVAVNVHDGTVQAGAGGF